MKKRIKRIFFIIILVLSLSGCALAPIDLNQYRGHAYIPAPGYEAIQTDRAIGKENGYTVYTLKNDPEQLFLYPKSMGLESRYLMVRDDVVLPHPLTDAVDRIEIKNAKGVSIVLDRNAQDVFVGIFQGKCTKMYQSERYDEAYQVRIYFNAFPQVVYVRWLYRYGDKYGLLLEDGTIAAVDAGTLGAL